MKYAPLILALVAGCRSTATSNSSALATSTPATSATASPVASPLPVDLSDIRRRELPPESGRVRPPGFKGATAWLNVDHPLALEELAGRVVVVDFWTSCCINCLHTLPVLRAIEQRFAPAPVVVIGVHSPKFTTEREGDRLREITAAYDVRHAVAVDADNAIWDAWGVRGWPTVAVLDTRGKMVWSGSGEPDQQELFGLIASALDEGAARGILAVAPLGGLTPPVPAQDRPLLYPGKLAPLSDGGLAISDSSHHRIVLTDRHGSVREVIGTGLVGAQDGDFASASFRRPQGVADSGGKLLIADTENHMLRVADTKTRMVTTAVGTGVLGGKPLSDGWTDGKLTSIRSPWDVIVVGTRVFIALAGSHQVAEYDPATSRIRAFAGSGSEARVDGDAMTAAFAQPSGLASDGRELFVLDSESSSVRAIDLSTRNVRTVVGKDLFVFGDQDGDATVARLQHPLGIAWGGGSIWVADTYNNKIKRIDARTGETHTVAGGSQHEALFEPAGLAFRNGELWIADTNHHQIAALKISGGELRAWQLQGLSAPASGVAVARLGPSPSDSWPVIRLGPIPIARSGPTTLKVEWELPSGTGINADAPYKLQWKQAGAPLGLSGFGRDIQTGLVATMPSPTEATSTIRAALQMVLCDIATHRVCVPFRSTLEIALAPTDGATNAVVRLKLPAAL